MTRVAVLGAGAWGTALASAFARAQPDVRLWGRDPAAVRRMAETRENAAHLPGVRIPDAVHITADLCETIEAAEIVVVAVPAQVVRSLLMDLRPWGAGPIVLAAKGIERTTGRFLSEVVTELLPGRRPAVLSGPSFAADVGRGRPTAVTIAAASRDAAAALGEQLGSPLLRLYHTDDLRGVEIGGAAKNVLAIACGIAHGRDLGASAGAALIARSFAELSRFGQSFGARPETLAGLSGLGDLVLTCGSAHSRNFAHGAAIGRGTAVDARSDGPVVEGVWTAGVLVDLADRRGVDMPICRSVAAVLAGTLDVAGAIDQLMARPPRAE